MGTIRTPLSVIPFVGMLSSDIKLFDACSRAIQNKLGPLSQASELFRWERTSYYEDELGGNVLRQFLFFERPCSPDLFPALKQFTNDLEQQYAVARDGGTYRRINLDPGYITAAKVVLVTTKDFAHRVYIGGGIYAEATLRYDAPEKTFVAHELTYPDFRTDAYIQLMNRERQRLQLALRGGKKKRSGYAKRRLRASAARPTEAP